MSSFRAPFAGVSRHRLTRRAFGLLHQHARKHGTRILLEPLVKQRINFFAEIGGVAQSRELVTLERIARCREKELPGRFGSRTGHVGLLKRDACKVNRQLINVDSTAMLLTVDTCGNLPRATPSFLKGPGRRPRTGEIESGADVVAAVMLACSACAGDYEDPDRTAWTPGEGDDADDVDAPEMPEEEFPAEK